jgi:hypothetical protein
MTPIRLLFHRDICFLLCLLDTDLLILTGPVFTISAGRTDGVEGNGRANVMIRHR